MTIHWTLESGIEDNMAPASPHSILSLSIAMLGRAIKDPQGSSRSHDVVPREQVAYRFIFRDL